MGLKERKEAFDALAKRSPCQRPSSLVCLYDLSEDALERLRAAVNLYMTRCLPVGRIPANEKELMQAFLENWENIPNITPNGMIVPKRPTILEYNIVVRTFAEIVDSFNIGDLILSWHVPLNVRFKTGEVNEGNLERHHPTEHIHSDSWAGESAESVTVHIPLFGDTERNCMVFYDPPEHFQEDWLGPLPSYKAGADIASRYQKMDVKVKRGQAVLADFSTLHSSSRFPGAKARVSIDTTFALKKRKSSKKETIHPWRVNERASHDTLLGLGATHLFVFPDSMKQQVDSRGGFRHPSHLEIVNLLPAPSTRAVATGKAFGKK